MEAFWMALVMSAAFGTFVGSLFRLSRRPGHERPMLFPLVGMIAGITALLIYQVVAWVMSAPAWLLPLLVVLQVWLWLGPLGPKMQCNEK